MCADDELLHHAGCHVGNDGAAMQVYTYVFAIASSQSQMAAALGLQGPVFWICEVCVFVFWYVYSELWGLLVFALLPIELRVALCL